jgi:hypothetical protein
MPFSVELDIIGSGGLAHCILEGPAPADRSGPEILNSAISGNSWHKAWPRMAGQVNHEQLDFLLFVKARPPSIRIPADGECVPQEPDRGPRRIRSVPDNRCACAK